MNSIASQGTSTAKRLVQGLDRLRHAVLAQADEVWHVLRLDDDARPRRPLPSHLRLRLGSPEDIEYTAPARDADVPLAMIERRFARGQRFWIVDSDDGPTFSCWIFSGYTPSAVAPGNRLDLPPGTLGLEDSFTASDFRGQGIAPAAWTTIADVLAEEGARALATPVAQANAASRRGVAKAGFEEVAVARLRRRAFMTRRWVEGDGEFAAWLRRSIAG